MTEMSWIGSNGADGAVRKATTFDGRFWVGVFVVRIINKNLIAQVTANHVELTKSYRTHTDMPGHLFSVNFLIETCSQRDSHFKGAKHFSDFKINL